MIDFFTRGGPLMYPILLCSVIGWAIFMERIFVFIKIRRNLRPLQNAVMGLIQEKKAEDAVDLCIQKKSPLAKILLVVLKNRGCQRSYLKALAEEVVEF